MSTILAWAAQDNRGVTAVYFAADSQISWVNANYKWLQGQKVFSLMNNGIFAYYGDVLLPTQIISQIKAIVDAGALFCECDNIIEQHTKIATMIQECHNSIPAAHKTKFGIIFCSTYSNNFFLSDFFYSGKKPLILHTIEEIKHPFYKCYGSGAEKLKYIIENKKKGGVLSRHYMMSMHQHVKSNEDPLTGGHIQLVGLYRNGKSQPYIFVDDNKKYMFGQELDAISSILLSAECRNKNFERCNAITGNLLSGAQRQPI